MKMKKVRSVLLAAALTCSMIVTPVMAAPDDTTSLQNQKESAQNEVNGLQAQLNELFTKTNDLETQLINKGQEITKAQEDLAVAEEKKQQQYEDMKLRIKYMYEEGDTSALERIVASGSISEMLTQTEYVEKVHTYDRDKLREYAETVQEVEDLKTSLESDMTKLQNLDEEYKTQTAELSSTIESKRAEVSNLDAMIQEAARAAVEAAKKEQEKNNTVNNENTNTPSGGGDNSGGTVTPAPEPTPTPTPDPTPTPTPTPEVEEIEEPEQPQVGHKGSWALINLIASLLGLLAALFLIFAKHSKEDDDEEDQNQTVAMNEEEDPEQLKRKRIYKWISGLTAVISVIVFVLTENMRLPMVLVDKWTLLMVVFFLINAVTLYLGRRWHEDEDDEEQTQA